MAASWGVQWRCEYLPPATPWTPTSRERCAIAVLEKIIHRGRVTTLSPVLEAMIRADLAAMTPIPERFSDLSQIDATDPDSPGERIFWQMRLPDLMGPDCWRWVVPQVDIECLGAPDSAGGRERVDFLISHPSLGGPLVVEVDGSHHREVGRGSKDVARDQRLREVGIEVIRVPAAEMCDVESQLDNLEQRLAPARQHPVPSRFFCNPYRRAGQIQLALLEAVRAGLLNPASLREARIHSDAVSNEDMTPSQFAATLADFRDLVFRVGRLYGLDWSDPVKSPLFGNEKGLAPDLVISFYGDSLGPGVIHVNDVALPLHIHHEPFLSEPASITEVSEDALRYFLERIFRKPSFRPDQYRAIARVLAGHDTLVLLPTGSGKSLVFQLASFLLPGRTFVVEPIVALIRDQVTNLGLLGIDFALGITADIGGAEAREIAYSRVASAQDLFYYVAPERFQMESFREAIRTMTSTVPTALIVMDEAHCVSEWGHDFRTSYLRVGDTARATCSQGDRRPPLVGLTGTASQAVLKDVQRELRLLEPECVLTPDSFDRPELHFVIANCDSDDKPALLKQMLDSQLPARLGAESRSFSAPQGEDSHCGLVFCPHRRGWFGAREISRDIRRTLGAAKIDYYCGSDPDDHGDETEWRAHKLRVERQFKRNELTVLACTKAFGMGVDKENVRYTIHYGIPGSIEAFYQEAGRAGRKRKETEPAFCCLIASLDRDTLDDRLLSDATTPEVETEEGIKRRPSRDDVDRLLYFHEKSFPGIGIEVEEIRACLSTLGTLGRLGHRTIRYRGDDDRSQVEKSIHRLSVLGVIEDYTVDFSAKHFDIRLSEARPCDVVEHYVKYVAGYSAIDAVKARKDTASLLDSAPRTLTSAFVLALATLFLEFVYDRIERGRRWGIWNMAQVCLESVEDHERFRRRVLAYLQVTEFAEKLEQTLGDETGGLNAAAEAIGNVTSPEKAEELRGQAARFLESYPDHPAIRFVRAGAELLCYQGSVNVAKEHLVRSIDIARERYGIADRAIAEACGLMLRNVWRMKRARVVDLERELLRQYGSPDFARTLVESGSVGVCELSAWYLLQPLADRSIELCRRWPAHDR